MRSLPAEITSTPSHAMRCPFASEKTPAAASPRSHFFLDERLSGSYPQLPSRRKSMAKSGAWLVLEEMLERGDPAFVDELRKFEDADQLAEFAPRWFQDRRAPSRRLLLEYLRRPLNAFRHEPLVKRLFKAAEKAGDDEVMAHFLVLFDRSIRRKKKKGHRVRRQEVPSRKEAEALVKQWLAEGAEYANQWGHRNTYTAMASWPAERIFVPRGTAMPRSLPDVMVKL